MKRRTYLALFLGTGAAVFGTAAFLCSEVKAVSYQSTEQVKFNINPSITVSVSGGLDINNLTPSNASDSNIINIVTESNAISGYSLYSTVGSDSNGTSTGNPSTELRRNGTDTTNKFTSITTNKTSLSDFNGSDWGYSYCNGDNTICTTTSDNWVSGNTGSTLSGYNGLPLYDSSSNNNNSSNNTAGIKLVDTTTSGSTTISFKIGAKASNSQIAGDYTNTINFIGVAKPNPEVLDKTFDEAFLAAGKTKYNGYYTMQDMDRSICLAVKIDETVQLIDTRDDTVYYVGKARDGQCWMLQNLKLGKKSTTLSLTSDTSNVSADGFTLDGKLTDGKFHAYTIDDVPYQNNSSEYYCTGDGTGTTAYESCYYNWYTATAGTGTTYISTQGQNVDSSICPAGWTLPTQPQFQSLYNNYNSAVLMEVDNPTTTKENSAGKIPGFLLSGYYHAGGAYNLGSGGYYWSRTAYSAQLGHYLSLNTSGVSPAYGNGKYVGVAVRCLVQQ